MAIRGGKITHTTGMWTGKKFWQKNDGEKVAMGGRREKSRGARKDRDKPTLRKREKRVQGDKL